MTVSRTRIARSDAPSDAIAPVRMYRWLIEGEYESHEWVVVDDLPTSPKPEKRIRWNVQVCDPKRADDTCLLTDRQYSHLLDTIKRQSIALRVGKYASVTTAYTYEEMTRHIVNWALWMIGNGIYR